MIYSTHKGIAQILFRILGSYTLKYTGETGDITFGGSSFYAVIKCSDVCRLRASAGAAGYAYTLRIHFFPAK